MSRTRPQPPPPSPASRRLPRRQRRTNRAGAGGEIGWSELARAKPDGYTIGFTNTPNIITVPIERQARFRFEDFAFIANIVDDPGGVWVLADSPVASLPALIAEARRRPGELSYG
ncbi:MAG: tripartite tricarboxylate transporter substrate-binding protein, partial [Actinomycetota bacterium]|nr:tripartite tricarboxylate transporter substrate-binding protein [Actinomycetota bacterium]